MSLEKSSTGRNFSLSEQAILTIGEDSSVTEKIEDLKRKELANGKIEREYLREVVERVIAAERDILGYLFDENLNDSSEGEFEVSIPLNKKNIWKFPMFLRESVLILLGYRYGDESDQFNAWLEIFSKGEDSTYSLELKIKRKFPKAPFSIFSIVLCKQ